MRWPKLASASRGTYRSMLNTFVRLTLLLALCIAAVLVGLFALKVIVIAAIIAALVIGVLFLVNLIRRIGARTALPTRR